MTLNAVYNDAGEIPEAYKDLYVEQDGRYRINVQGVQLVEETQGLHSALQKERDLRKSLEQQVKTYGDIDPAKYSELAKRVPELERALEGATKEEKDKINAIVEERLGPLTRDRDNKISGLESALNEHRQRAESAETALRDRVFDETIDKFARDAGVRDDALPAVRHYARTFGWKMDQNLQPVAQRQDGTEVYSRLQPSQPVSMTEYFKHILPAEASFLFKESAGGGAEGSKGGPKGMPSRAGMTADQKAAYIQAHGMTAFLSLPK